MAVRRPPIIRGALEPATPRVCVAPTVAQALGAVWWVRGIDVAVYVSEPRRTIKPSGVLDQSLTGERWIVPPVRFYLLGRIPAEVIEDAQFGLSPLGVGGGLRDWWRRSMRLSRMAAVVCVHLPQAHERWVGKFADRCVCLFAERLAEARAAAVEE